jgi:hypothetical protein
MKRRVSAVLLSVLLIFSSVTYGHSGRTDSSGGHRDNKNASGLGSYHYHHGYGPHLHSNGVCPYRSTSTSSTTSARTSYSSKVKEYQYKLNKLGYDCGLADGYLGTNTKSALMNFQEKNYLTKVVILIMTPPKKLILYILQPINFLSQITLHLQLHYLETT